MVEDLDKFPTIIIAVSGGVDSVVLLDMLVRHCGNQKLIVAHVDHGIRKESYVDAAFVAQLAKQYGLLYETTTLQLGMNASEECARAARYDFLLRVSKKHGGAPIVTAHHGDDVIESIVLNIQRGTGWRGLAVLQRRNMYRPLTHLFKGEIIAYAIDHRLTWNEDTTNNDMRYARNRIRSQVAHLPVETKRSLLRLWHTQCTLRHEIEREIGAHVTDSRHAYIMWPDVVAMNILGEWLARHGVSLTRPQLMRCVIAIRTARPRTRHSIDRHHALDFSTRNFHLRTVEK